VQTRVTILCPRFEVGANTDVWDEALNSSASAKRKSTMPGSMAGADDGGTRQPEAGKIWEKGRNWTTVIVEVIPGTLPGTLGNVPSAGGGDVDLDEDEDVCEIPVFVRLDYDTDAAAGEERVVRASEGKERREVAFWCVLGVGRIVG
jgi:dynactin-4